MNERTDPGESAEGIIGTPLRPIDSVSVPAVVIDGRGVIRVTNQAWRLFGELNGADPVATGPGADYLAAAGGADDQELVEGLRGVLAGRQVFFEREYLCSSPTEDRWFLMRVVAMPVDDATGALVVHLDVTADHLAATADAGGSADPVTGLVDRATAAAMVEERIAQGEVVPAGLAVTTVHLRGLDDVVRALGPKAGEKVLVQVVARTNRLVRRGDVLCRSGPATLTLVRPSAGDEDARASLVDRLAAAFDHPFQVGVHQVFLAVEVRSGGQAVTVGTTRVLSPAEWDLHGPGAPQGRLALDEVVRARTSLLDAVGEAVLALDGQARVVHMNTAAEQLFGWSNDDARGRHLDELGSSDLTSEQVDAVVRHVWAGGTWADDLVIRLRSGRRFEAQVSAAPLMVEGQVSAVITSTVDVSRRLAAVADLSHQVRHDRLTGLRNRAALIESLDEVLADVASSAAGSSAAVIVVDLEDFRAQNRVLGPAMGDHLLRATAAALRQATHPGDVLARVSGDAFAVCCSHLGDDAGAVRYADHLREAVARPVILGGIQVVLRSSAGVALVHPPTPSSSELLRRADAALLDAKAMGRASLAYHHQMDERLRRQALLEVLIRRMVAGGRAPLAYQSIVRLGDGAVIGAEALLRVRGDSGVLVSPHEVFAAADRAGLSRDVGRLVLEAACREARRWADALPERQLSVSVNISPEQFADHDIADQVRAALEAAQLDPSRLCLEISEAILLDDTEWSARQLALLKMLGVVLVADDYGAGHTSLVHLKRFPLDSIKIDLSLVAGLPDSPEDLAVVTATMGVADALGLRVVAVGIEDRRQLTELDRLGCHYGQGFLWSPATTSEEFADHATAPVSVMPDRTPSAGLAAAPAAAPASWTEELDSILRSLVHEVRTPLTVAMGYASMLEHGSDDDRVELSGRIRAATERINRLLANLEDVRLIDNGDLLLEVHRQDVRALVEGIVDDLRGVVHRDLVLVQDGDDEVLVDVDDVRIGGGITNLVTNAAKYAQPSSPVGIEVSVDAEWARITVTDDGPGVADADLGLLYRKYGRADRSHRGSGLGLYLARGSARAHGGDITYRRRQPGSAFTLSIPRCARTDDRSAAQPSDGNGSGSIRS